MYSTEHLNKEALHLWSLPHLEAWACKQLFLQMPCLPARIEEGPAL